MDKTLTKETFRHRACCERDDTTNLTLSGCEELAQREYKKARHDKISAIHKCHMRQKYGFATIAKDYECFIDNEMAVLENEAVKLLSDFAVQNSKEMDLNKPDLILLDKK